MTQDDLTRGLQGLQRRLREVFGVAALYVFGSVARGEAVAGSDVDLLVEFEGPPTFARFMDLKFLLEDTLGVCRSRDSCRAARPDQAANRIRGAACRVMSRCITSLLTSSWSSCRISAAETSAAG